MNVQYRRTGLRHGIVTLKSLPKRATSFSKRLRGVIAVNAVVAKVNGEVVGFLRYIPSREGYLLGCGTWVRPDFRRRGIGKGLWLHALEREKLREVDVTAISRGGANLIKSLEKAGVRVHLDCNF